mgnify:CR=1 FL=1
MLGSFSLNEKFVRILYSWPGNSPVPRPFMCKIAEEILKRQIQMSEELGTKIKVENDVLKYAIPRMERSFLFAKKLVEELDLESLKTNKPIKKIMVNKIIEKLNNIAGENGIGRVVHVENRLVGIKSREVYEAPAATVIHESFQSLEKLVLNRDQSRMKNQLEQSMTLV